MIRRETGFTFIEVLVAMSIFIVIVSAIMLSFLGLLTQFKEQSKMTETNVEGIIGLEILRRDIEHAGFGLPWNGLINYTENAGYLNDAPSGTPRAIISINATSDADKIAGSDVLVIKSLNVDTSDTAQKWTTLKNTALYANTVNTWSTAGVNENLGSSDNVIVVSPGSSDVSSLRTLQTNGGTAFYAKYSDVKAQSGWQPSTSNSFQDVSGNVVSDTWLVHGLTPSGTTPDRPFNRADYFISTTAGTIPARCASGTGVLYKAVLKHGGNGSYNYLPVLDCVADMQVMFELDINGDGIIDTESNDISALTAQQVRDQVKEVRVYILAQEGQKDSSYSYPNNSISVGGASGRNFNLTTIPNYRNYRWKLYTLSVKPTNLE